VKTSGRELGRDYRAIRDLCHAEARVSLDAKHRLDACAGLRELFLVRRGERPDEVEDPFHGRSAGAVLFRARDDVLEAEDIDERDKLVVVVHTPQPSASLFYRQFQFVYIRHPGRSGRMNCPPLST
jgi:hypothetical protein